MSVKKGSVTTIYYNGEPHRFLYVRSVKAPRRGKITHIFFPCHPCREIRAVKDKVALGLFCCPECGRYYNKTRNSEHGPATIWEVTPCD